MSADSIDFVQRLVEQIPAIKLIYDEHLDYFGELLPHVFFGELTRWLLSLFSSVPRSQNVETQLWAVLNYLEQSFIMEGEEIKELIAVSILENLPRPGEQNSGIIELLGPELVAEYARINRL